MGCFTLGFLENLFVYLIVIGAIYAIINLLIPMVTQFLGAAGGTIGQILNIILIAIICIMVIYIVFGLLSCMVGSGGLSLMPPHR